MQKALYAIPVAAVLVALGFFVIPQQQADAAGAEQITFLGNKFSNVKLYLDDGSTGLGYIYDIQAVATALEASGQTVNSVNLVWWGNATSSTPNNCISGAGCPQVLFLHVSFTGNNGVFTTLLIPAENIRIIQWIA